MSLSSIGVKNSAKQVTLKIFSSTATSIEIPGVNWIESKSFWTCKISSTKSKSTASSAWSARLRASLKKSFTFDVFGTVNWIEIFYMKFGHFAAKNLWKVSNFIRSVRIVSILLVDSCENEMYCWYSIEVQCWGHWASVTSIGFAEF